MSGHKYQVEFLPYREGPWSNSDGFVSEFFVFIGDAMQRAEQLVRDSLAEEAEVSVSYTHLTLPTILLV